VPMPIPLHTVLIAFIMIFVAVPTLAHASCVRIQALAQEHSNSMAKRDRMDHDGMEGRRARGALAENVAVGCKTKACAMQQWRNSPAHNANMNLPSSTYPCKIVASTTSRSGTTYWTMEIGDDEAKAKFRKARAAKSRAARGWSWSSSQ
jgi:Cysteine-rich secretory protein family